MKSKGVRRNLLRRARKNDVKYHGTVAVKTFIVEINILCAISGTCLLPLQAQWLKMTFDVFPRKT